MTTDQIAAGPAAGSFVVPPDRSGALPGQPAPDTSTDLRDPQATLPPNANDAQTWSWLYWRAKHFQTEGEHGRAAALLASLAQLAPGVSAHLHLDAADAAAAAGQPQAASAHLDAAAMTTPRARRIQARIALAQNKPAQALAPLGQAIGDNIWLDNDECALGVQILKQILKLSAPDIRTTIDQPAAAALPALEARCANKDTPLADLLGALRAKAPGAVHLRPTHRHRLTRARHHLKVAENKNALEILLELLDDKAIHQEMDCRASFWAARALKALKRWSETRPYYQRAAQRCTLALAAQSDDLRLLRTRALYWSATRHWKAKDRRAARAAFERILDEADQTRYADDALYHLMKIDRADGKAKAAAAHLRRMIEQYPAGDMTRQAVWEPINQALKDSRWADARDALIDAAQMPPDPTYYSQGRAWYYLGYAQQQLGDKSAAQAAWRTAFERNPSAFYGHLSAQSLLRTNAGKQWLYAQPRPQKALPLTFDVKDPAVRGFIRLGDFARASKLALATAGKDTHDLWLGAWLAHLGGHYTISHNVARRRVPGWPQRYGMPTEATRLLWEIAYPDPYGRLIEHWANDRGIDPFFVRSIMREESGFDPYIISWAGAVGLMQLILPTAKGNAKGINVPITRQTLTRPEVNLPIATRFMRQLFSRFGTEPILLACGYNAGPGAPAKWLKERGGWNIGLFAEAVPYSEARNYSRRVTGSYGIYQWLWHQNEPLVRWSLTATPTGK